MNEPFSIYLISGTHWDREWYQDFQGFRWRLVSMMDDALKQLKAHPDFPVFNLDGQTIPLKDYLEIAPEKESEIREMIRKGRLVIGPWYVMPDEFLLSGESLIQNLLIGRRICKEFDADPLPVGYICDIFGHAAQTPQIFAGFGFLAQCWEGEPIVRPAIFFPLAVLQMALSALLSGWTMWGDTAAIPCG